MSRLARLVEVVRSLPPTPLRPQGSPQLSDALESIISRQFPSASASASASASSSTSTSATGALDEPNEQRVARMLGPLERLTAGSALAEYPLSAKTLRPAHDALYYKRILDGVHRSARGEGRSWWRRFFQVRGDA